MNSPRMQRGNEAYNFPHRCRYRRKILRVRVYNHGTTIEKYGCVERNLSCRLTCCVSKNIVEIIKHSF